jgi:hypothetical protein
MGGRTLAAMAKSDLVVPLSPAEMTRLWHWARMYEREPGQNVRWLLRRVLAGEPDPALDLLLTGGQGELNPVAA